MSKLYLRHCDIIPYSLLLISFLLAVNGVWLVSQLKLYLLLTFIAPCYHNFVFIIETAEMAQYLNYIFIILPCDTVHIFINR